LLSVNLKSQLPGHDGHSFFLQIMHMHRRTGARLSAYFDLETIATLIVHDTQKDERFTRTVFNLARISMHQVSLILHVFFCGRVTLRLGSRFGLC
jgi:hypothetical protein